MASVAELAKIYADCCGAGVVLTDAWLLPQHAVELERAVPDVDEERKRLLRYRLRWSDSSCPAPSELPPAVSSASYAPSGQRLLRVVKLEKPKPRSCLELWQHGSLLARLDAGKLHGKVLPEGGVFGGFGWSNCEQRVAYIAELAEPEYPPLFGAAGGGGSGGDSQAGGSPTSLKDLMQAGASATDRHVFREDWGEKCGGSDRLGLFVADFKAMSITRAVGVPDDVTPGQPVFWGDDLVYAGWSAGARRLGVLLCLQRPSALFAVRGGNLDAKEHAKLSPGLKLARSPRPGPRGAAGKGPLAFLGSSAGFDTHTSCLELFVLDAGEGALPRVVVPVVDRPVHGGFAGICLDNALPRCCWGCGHIYFNTQVGARLTVWRVEIASAASAPLPQASLVSLPTKGADASSSVRCLAVSDSTLVLAWSTPCQPERVMVRSLRDEGDVMELPVFGPCPIACGVPRGPATPEGLRWSVQGVSPADGGQRFDAVLVEPVHFVKPGLVLFLHGGPHAGVSTAYTHIFPFLVQATSCAVLAVNYRGSIGFGRQALETLPGRCGVQDVEDCMAALDAALSKGVFDETRVAVVGGSHGGFLTAHLIGQHPERFAAAAMRNPVTNLLAMTSVTDIPDWCFVEGLGLGSYNFAGFQAPTAEQAAVLRERSPLAHVGKVRTPALLALGLKDRRVPPSQGLEYYHALRARGAVTRLLCYPDECHSLDGPAVDADHWVNVAAWFNEHLPPPMPQDPGVPADLARASSLGV